VSYGADGNNPWGFKEDRELYTWLNKTLFVPPEALYCIESFGMYHIRNECRVFFSVELIQQRKSTTTITTSLHKVTVQYLQSKITRYK
jgi:hypothetical protein